MRSALALGFLAFHAPCVAAQRDTTARLAGVALSSLNGQPLASVMIAVPAARQFAVTDSTGRFLLTALPAGRQLVRIAYEGRESEEYELELRRGKTKELAVVLDVDAVVPSAVVVEAPYYHWRRDLAGFFQRRQWNRSFARFFTREDIDRLRAPSLSFLLARAGVFTRCMQDGCVPVRTAFGGCKVAVTVDGMPFWERQYDEIPIDEVAGVEVYRGLGPGESRMFQLARGTCGSVQIWLR